MKEFVIVKGSVVKYDGDWWQVLNDTGQYLRIEYVHRRASGYGVMPVIQKTIPKHMVEDCRVSVNNSWQYQVVKHDHRIDVRRFENFKAPTFTINAKNARCASTKDAIRAVDEGEHLFSDVKKPIGLCKERLALHNRELALLSRIKAIENYYTNPNFCKSCRKVILIRKDEKAKDAKARKYCDSCRADLRINNLTPKQETVKQGNEDLEKVSTVV